MSIGEQIKKRREELGMSQSELAKTIGVTQGSIGNYETGVSNPKMELMPKIFEALQTDANYFFHEANELKDMEVSYPELKTIKKYRALDKHGKKIVDFIIDEEYNRCTTALNSTPPIELRYSTLAASAGTGNFLEDENIETREFLDTPEARRADIVIPVSGDSMEPMFEDGDELLVRLQPSVEPGEIGVFIMNNCGYVKRFEEDRLVSLNPDYDDIYPDAEVRCVGKVIGIAESAEEQV